MRVLAFVLLFVATGANAETFTRAEVAKLSPQELAVRVLGEVASLGSAEEIKTYISPAAPTPPWLERVAIALPPTYIDNYSLCMSNYFFVDFAPLAPDANQHMFDSTYDPPTRITRVDVQHRYAAMPSCEKVTDADYFSAESDSDAATAMDAFKMFRAQITNNAVVSCSDFAGDNYCKPGIAAGVTRFESVLSIQEDRHKDVSITRTVVLSISNPYGESKTELWLTVEFAKDVKLVHAELRHLWADPIP
jgi:hypothetical protein